MFRMPTNPLAREALGDLAHVAEVLNPANLHKMPDIARAMRNARAFFEAEKAAKALNIICLDSSNDNRLLVKIGRRGGRKTLWNFGNGRA